MIEQLRHYLRVTVVTELSPASRSGCRRRRSARLSRPLARSPGPAPAPAPAQGPHRSLPLAAIIMTILHMISPLGGRLSGPAGPGAGCHGY
jgi:hypothetical protein